MPLVGGIGCDPELDRHTWMAFREPVELAPHDVGLRAERASRESQARDAAGFSTREQRHSRQREEHDEFSCALLHAESDPH